MNIRAHILVRVYAEFPDDDGAADHAADDLCDAVDAALNRDTTIPHAIAQSWSVEDFTSEEDA